MSVSPQLALAAAAAIKDKALEEQTLQLIALQNQLRELQEVEITGRMGRPVYCRGSFQDGDFRSLGRSDDIMDLDMKAWEVKLENVELDGISLLDLGMLEIRLGGVVYATSSAVMGTQCSVRVSGGPTDRVFSGRTFYDLKCFIKSGDDSSSRNNRRAWLSVNFRNLPEGPWKHLQSCAKFNNRSENRNERTDIFHYVTDPTQYPRRMPNQKADVTSISFHGRSVLKLIKNINRADEEFEKTKEKFIAHVSLLMRE